MSLASILAAGRRAAEARMVDACTLKRETGQAMDPVTLEMVPTYATLYAGKCEVQLTAAVALTPEAAERVQVVQRTQIKLPVSAHGVDGNGNRWPAVDDLVDITAAVNDADLVGREYRVRLEFAKTHATARRLECEEGQT